MIFTDRVKGFFMHEYFILSEFILVIMVKETFLISKSSEMLYKKY